MSKASVLLPEPDTPVMTLNLPRGMSTSIDFRLCSRALTMRIDLARRCSRARRAHHAFAAARPSSTHVQPPSDCS